MEYRKKSGEEPRLCGGFCPHVCELPVKNFRVGKFFIGSSFNLLRSETKVRSSRSEVRSLVNLTFDLELQTFAKFSRRSCARRPRRMKRRMKRLNLARLPCFFVSTPSARLYAPLASGTVQWLCAGRCCLPVSLLCCRPSVPRQCRRHEFARSFWRALMSWTLHPAATSQPGG